MILEQCMDENKVEDSGQISKVQEIKDKIANGIENNTLETTQEEGKKVEDLCGVGSKTNEIGAGADFLKSLRKKK